MPVCQLAAPGARAGRCRAFPAPVPLVPARRPGAGSSPGHKKVCARGRRLCPAIWPCPYSAPIKALQGAAQTRRPPAASARARCRGAASPLPSPLLRRALLPVRRPSAVPGALRGCAPVPLLPVAAPAARSPGWCPPAARLRCRVLAPLWSRPLAASPRLPPAPGAPWRAGAARCVRWAPRSLAPGSRSPGVYSSGFAGTVETDR